MSSNTPSPLDERIAALMAEVKAAEETKDLRRALNHALEAIRIQSGLIGVVILMVDGLLSPEQLRSANNLQKIREAIAKEPTPIRPSK